MKKLIMIFAMVSLVTSSLLNMANLTKHHRSQILEPTKNQQKNFGAINEDAEDIANKLFNKSIKLDPNFWLGKNIKDDQSQFNATVVKDGILTQDEIQYVTWGNLNINVAGYFLNKLTFSVTKDGAVATGTSTIDADTGETTAQIATKISKATNIKLNYNYWNTKAVQDNLPALRDILVNDHILTKAEASLITGANATTITKAGQISLNLTVNDYKTSSNASLNTDVVNDGHSASQIASEINGSGFGLKVNTAGMYADSSYVTKNFDNLLTANYGISASDLNYVSLPHIKLKVDNPQTKGQVLKDGQTAIATVDLECKTSPYIYYYIVNNNYVQAYVNLNAKFISYLKSYFPGKSNWKILQYFYNMLDDGNDPHLQDYTGTSLIPWANRLDQNMKTFGNTDDPPSQILKYESDDSISSTNSFAQQLYNAVMHSNNELSIMFEWRYYMHTIFEKNYETKQWKFW